MTTEEQKEKDYDSSKITVFRRIGSGPQTSGYVHWLYGASRASSLSV